MTSRTAFARCSGENLLPGMTPIRTDRSLYETQVNSWSGERIVRHAVHADCWPLIQVPVSGSPQIGPYGGRCVAKRMAELGLLAELAELSANPVDHDGSSIENMC